MKRMHMPKTASRLAAAFFALILLTAAAPARAGEAAVPSPQMAYEAVLETYRKALGGDEAALEAREGAWLAWVCVDGGDTDPLRDVGYAFIDLNADGSPELVIGETGADSGRLIFEILTLQNGEPVTAKLGWDRYRVSLIYDPLAARFGYYAEGSSGAANSVFECAWAGPDLTQWPDMLQIEFNGDFETGEETWTLGDAVITEEAAAAIIGAWQRLLLPLPLHPFAE